MKIPAPSRLRIAIEEIVGFPFARPSMFAPSWEDTCRAMAVELQRELDHRSTSEQFAVTALIRALVRQSDNPCVALVNDIAEILFMPRAERSEYRNHRLPSPPYVIEKLLLEYALLAVELDDLIGRLSKSFCAAQCPTAPVGCCHLLGYDMGLVPDRMLSVQRLEAVRNGWRAPTRPDVEKCRYHTQTGCTLRLFKSPACIGAMCTAVGRHLDTRYPPSDLAVLREKLQTFRNCDIDRTEVFRAMRSVIDAGRRF